MSDPLFTDNFKQLPYWWEHAPRPQIEVTDLPGNVDVAIIGSGYTGLCAGIQTARAGRSTLILDAEDAGWGCSSRNGGQVSTSFKPSVEQLSKQYGTEKAVQILREGHNALAWISDFVTQEGIECDFHQAGRFHAAHNPGNTRRWHGAVNTSPKGWRSTVTWCHVRSSTMRSIPIDTTAVSSLPTRLATPWQIPLGFTGAGAGRRGVYRPTQQSRQYRARWRGVCSAHRTRQSQRTRCSARNQWLHRRANPWQQRRIIPIGSYVIATETLDVSQVEQLLPGDRVYSDTRKLVVYYRASPDRRHIVFGGRVSIQETDPRTTAPHLHREMVRILPALKSTKISHSWMGFVGYTFDSMPHIGQHQGVYYAMGYCGSGVSLASYFGTRLGQRLLA